MKKRLPSNCELVIPFSWSKKDIIQQVREVEILISWRASRELIEAGKKLMMIQQIGTGVDMIDIEAATERGITICNAKGFNAIPCAEHIMALILAIAKNLTKHDKIVRNGGWRGMHAPSFVLYGKTMGIIGLGSIGEEIARRTKAFGMKIMAIERSPSEQHRRKLEIDYLGGPADLVHILKESDFIVLTVPLTPETKGIIGDKEFQAMKKSAYLINISRGLIVDEKALINALKEGIIAGAGLDVFEKEPIAHDNPLLQLPNVVLTPHIAGSMDSKELQKERVEFLAQNIEKFIRGETPDNIVDVTLKYVP
jgi:D-3-phosphoglycerate dehydrogenase